MKKLIVYTDGASRGNPGPAAYGFTVADEKGKLLHEEGEYIGITTNNVAEYSGVLEALKLIKQKYQSGHPLQIAFFADSKLVAEQLSGRYKIKAKHLMSIIRQIQDLCRELGEATFSHVPRAKNFPADKLANQALDSLN